METKRVNVFDQTPRKIRCIQKKHDYLGDGSFITEEELEWEKLYSYAEVAQKAMGIWFFLKNCRQNMDINHICLKNWNHMMKKSF